MASGQRAGLLLSVWCGHGLTDRDEPHKQPTQAARD